MRINAGQVGGEFYKKVKAFIHLILRVFIGYLEPIDFVVRSIQP